MRWRAGWRGIWHGLGLIITVASLVFVFRKLASSGLWTIEQERLPALLGALMAGAALYAGCSFLLSTAWARQLRWLGAAPPGWPRGAHAIYGRTQIAKYFPGNVLHLASRHLAGRTAGLGHVALATAAVLEVCGLVAAAATVAMLAPRSELAVSAMLPLAVTLPFAVPALLKLVAQRTGWASLSPLTTRRYSKLAASFFYTFLLYLTFFVAAGTLLLLLAVFLIGPGSIDGATTLVGAFAVSWIAGFVTPGAPAGVGIREVVLIAMLGPLMGEQAGIAVALGFRVLTTLGDLFFFLLALIPAMPEPQSDGIAPR